MAPNYASAVRKGTMAAERIHRNLDLRDQIKLHGGNVNVFAAIQSVGLPLLLRPLQGLLGAYLSQPTPGVLVTTQRPMSVFSALQLRTSSAIFYLVMSPASMTKQVFFVACRW